MKRRDFLVLGSAASALAALGPAAFAAADGGEVLALVEKDAGSLGFYALPGGRRIAGIDLGTQPHEIVADAQGRYAYVAQYGVARWRGPGAGGDRIFVVDLATRRLQRTIDLSPYRRLHGIRMDAAGRLYVLAEIDSVLIRFDDPAHSDVPDQAVPLGGARSHYFAIRGDGARAYVADTLSGMVIAADPHDASVPPIRRRSGKGPEGCCLSPDESTFYVVNRYGGDLVAYDARDLRELRRAPTRGEAVRIVSLPDGRLVVSNETDRSLSLLRPDTLAEERRVPLDAAAPGLNLAADGRLYAALDDDSVAVIDTATWTTEARFATHAGPDAAVVLPGRRS
ncbi:YncE family protein [Luteimonas sp. BDR2-5]|uniref:YncE family protein n=1 Tax=Proluteimonas luteida TaxID=2878685 RepID=UPI001E5F001D|nr:YncE family protein [Luteimonas sp. BDR2-5]MCD9028367.1 YncE family protein [Luteimonas sp. BDR2-5]